MLCGFHKNTSFHVKAKTILWNPQKILWIPQKRPLNKPTLFCGFHTIMWNPHFFQDSTSPWAYALISKTFMWIPQNPNFHAAVLLMFKFC